MVKYIQNYALYQSIGSGVYGKVYRAINNNDKKQYAIKVIPINKFRQNKKLQQCTVNQINILTNIQANQHIIKYYDMLKTSNNFYFIYEFCNGGTLQGLLSRQGKLSQQSALLIFKQLLQAFQVLNKYNIMHRDLKPDNIFFHNGVIKLGDFGFCKNLNSADQMAKTMLGSPIYMAPEVLKGQIYSNKADIWSLGVVLYQMLFGHCPFQSNSIAKLIQVLNTKQLEFPGNVSNFLKDLIQKMLTKDPAKRVGWMEMFQIKISNQGIIQSDKIKAISSLSDAKFSQETGLMLSTKFSSPASMNTNSLSKTNYDSFPNVQSQNNSVSNNSNNLNNINNSNNNNINNANSNINNTNTVISQQQQQQSSSVQPQMNSINQNSNNVNNNINNNQSLSVNDMNFKKNRTSAQIQLPTSSNNFMIPNQNNQVNPQMASSPNSQQIKNNQANISNRITQQHKLILQGIKLSMQIIQSKIPNYSGYSHLIISKNITLIENLLLRPFRKQIIQILQKQIKDLKNQRQFITSKMFSYQLKGLDDWKKYLRGKFFQDEKTILIWYKMIHFLNNPGNQIISINSNYNQMAQSIKSVLY